jgi:hypothetical protein
VQNVEFYDILGGRYFPHITIEGNTVIFDVSNFSVGTYTTRVLYLNQGHMENSILSFIVEH